MDEVKQYMMEQQYLDLELHLEEETLEVVEATRIMPNSGRELGPLITYRRDGSTFNQYQRINILTQTPSPLLPSQTSQAQTTPLTDTRPPRYFDVESSEKQQRVARCFRCGKKGHFVRHCPIVADQQQCLYCLGDHTYSQCNTKNCFQCNQIGHMAKDCKAARVRCCKCGNKGHAQEECGVIVFLNSSGIRFDHKFRQQYGLSDLMKVRCLANCKFPMGHFNCHQYEDVKDKFYPEAAKQKTILREKYLLSNVHKLRQTYFKKAAKNSSARILPSKDSPIERQEGEGEMRGDAIDVI